MNNIKAENVALCCEVQQLSSQLSSLHGEMRKDNIVINFVRESSNENIEQIVQSVALAVEVNPCVNPIFGTLIVSE